MSVLDYGALGFKAGLEIHQQLDTRKLFCRCRSELDEVTSVAFARQLRPTQSELGEVDPAALAEALKGNVFRYEASRHTSCLVDMDEEPPHDVTPEAADVALTVALLLNARLVDEVHVMRKIVIDGSNTSGFQRTALFALDGQVESSHGAVRIDTIALEEDSARKLERTGNVVGYRLDRLGIPLVEIATAPDIKGPEHAREVALAIGSALRATGRVKRGLGTIRQDLNVSIREGARVEIKGVQTLQVIPLAVEHEVRRQLKLLDVKRQLASRGAKPDAVPTTFEDVSPLFKGVPSKPVEAALKSKGVVLALKLPGFAGLIGKKDPKEAAPQPRLGREFADYAKVRAGVRGVFHSDELPAYGIAQEVVDKLREHLALKPEDAFVLVADRRSVAQRALEAVADRARMCFQGVPEETREVEEDGGSKYLRPLPGGARMYPETDVPPFAFPVETIETRKQNLPELWPAKLERFKREYKDLSEEQAVLIVKGEDVELFEALAKQTGLVKEVARVLVNTLPELEREGVSRERITDATIRDAFTHLKAGAFAKEALPQVLRHVAQKGGTVEQAAAALGLGSVDLSEVEAVAQRLVEENAQLVRERGAGAQGPLMGPLMAQFRGKVAGQELSRILSRKIEALLAKQG